MFHWRRCLSTIPAQLWISIFRIWPCIREGTSVGRHGGTTLKPKLRLTRIWLLLSVSYLIHAEIPSSPVVVGAKVSRNVFRAPAYWGGTYLLRSVISWNDVALPFIREPNDRWVGWTKQTSRNLIVFCCAWSRCATHEDREGLAAHDNRDNAATHDYRDGQLTKIVKGWLLTVVVIQISCILRV